MTTRTKLRCAYAVCAILAGSEIGAAICSLVLLNPIGAAVNIGGTTIWSLLSDHAAEKLARNGRRIGTIGKVRS